MYEKYQTLWNETLKEIKIEYEPEIYEEIFKPVDRVYKFYKNIIYVVAPTEFHKSRIEQFYIRKVVSLLQIVANESYDVKIITEDYINKDKKVDITSVDPNISNLYRHNLKATYTFDNYVVGANNRFAYMLGLQVADRPGTIINPLYIFGGVGLGKTHLMQAIGNYILDNDQNIKVLYVKTEVFIEDYINKIKTKKDAEFNKKYNNIDVLLIDDIQFLAKKEQSQLEFFKIFERMHNENKQIIITSDRPAYELKDMMDRLTSRFEWGTQADIKAPDVHTRIDILKKKIASERIDHDEIPSEILEYIASNFSTNIRILEGALKRVLFYATMMNNEITLELTKEALKDILPKVQSLGSVSITNIQREVCEYYNIPFEQLISKSRKAKFVLPRQIAMYISRELTGSSFPQIGKEFGGKDHTTVMHSIQKINKLKIIDDNLSNDLETLIDKLK
ncbi:chromosomal replication initiator protein DnaA [Haloplasma contractile]|uniref:Chromosomal replication initiator protein DnaA n=1 Tax=Haloplasma contractile SSD-17B TaxID=1033810 RepID=F7PWT7_9MOLU|nr:chromosomal replication initiator protein DnaA [Haloplasma contractile]ERJ12538.1 Chromosomal replication initiator protein DnaA [Haloplasma contractile SSD-17B]